jgi:hypothetical protein
MEIITIETQPTAEKNVALVNCRFGDINLMGINRGISLWAELFNANGGMFDGCYVQIDGSDWTQWPAGLTPEEDNEYVSAIILKRLGLQKRLKAPYFTSYPNSQYVVQDSNVSFIGIVNGYPKEFTYQWSKNSDILPDATGNIYSINNVTNTDAATYLLTVSNTQGTVSGSASLTVIPFAAPVITAQPNNLNLSSGYFGQMYIVANGVPNPNYQWRKDGVDVVSGIYSSLVFNNVKEQDAGNYDVVVSNNVGSITSSGATLTINSGVHYIDMMMNNFVSGTTI